MLKNYLKMAIKVLLRRKFFTFISLFGISFTLLILMLVISLVDHTIGPMPPESKLDRTLSVIHITITSPDHGTMAGPLLSYYCMEKYIRSLQTPEKVSISSFFNPIVVYKDKKKLNLSIKFSDAVFWDIMDFDFIEGKPFTAKDVEDINRVAVINEDTRRKYFNDEIAVGKTIEADGKDYRIIGVVENVPILRMIPYSDIWVPITNSKEDLDAKTVLSGGFPGFHAMILARDRSDFPAIKAELDKNFEQFDFLDTNYEKIYVNAETYVETISRAMFMSQERNLPGMMMILFTLLVLFLLLPTINLVNINVSRIRERASEIGVRKSFGASSKTLVGQFVVENVVLTLIGGAIGLILTATIMGIINQSGFIKYTHLAINFRIFMVSLIICLFFGFFSGVYPAWKMSRMKPVAALRGGE